jgi:hypothetical protein
MAMNYLVMILALNLLKNDESQSQKFCYDRRPTRPVCLGVKPHLGSKTRFLLLSDSCGFVDVRFRL